MKALAITRLALIEQQKSRLWLIAIGLAAITVFFSPALAPIEIDPTLAAPARAQTAYAALLLFAGICIPFIAAELGRNQVTRNHRAFWASSGVGDWVYFGNLLLAIWVQLAVACVTCGIMICLMAGGFVELVPLLQALTLTFLSLSSAAALVIGLSQRLTTSIAGLIGVAWNLLGFYGVTLFGYGREYAQNSPGQQAVFEFFWTVIPHLRIGDQSERIVFGWPAIEWIMFGVAALYLSSWAVITGGLGWAVFRGKR